jgi:hypothetical protein
MMRHMMRVLAVVLGMLLLSTVSAHADAGLLHVTVGAEDHFIQYQASIEHLVNDLRDPARLRVSEGVFVAFEVFDAHPTRIIEKVSVKMPPTTQFPEGVEIDLPLGPNDPGDTGVDFFLRISYVDSYAGTFQFTMKLTTGHKIAIDPFPITLQRLPDLQNVQFLDDTTKPVLRWATIPGSDSYRVKIQDPETGLRVFVGNRFFVGPTPGPIQMVDLKTAPGFPADWPGMEIGKRYVFRIEGRLRGSPLSAQFVPLPAIPGHAPVHVPAPPPGQGQITRSMTHVGYTPLAEVVP